MPFVYKTKVSILQAKLSYVMSHTLRITGLAGSLRSASYSRSVLATIAEMLPDGAKFEAIDIGSLPHYNEDLERTALPEPVTFSREMVAASDAVLIVTPEFNHGIPGVLKNALDWLSRPAFDSCLIGKPVLFATLSPGALGGVRAQSQLRETLASMLCKLTPLQEIAITHIGSKVDHDRLVDAPTLKHIQSVLQRFLSNAVPA
jgi:chromate reductase